MQSDLISKQALIKFIDKKVVPELLLHDNASGAGVMAGLIKVLEETGVIPTIDAVPVVRCRECIYASASKFSEKRVECGYWAQMVSADGYCSNGVTEDKYNGKG